MALDIDQVPCRVLDALKERGYSDEEIRQMSSKEAFVEFCEWEGLIGWGDTLWEMMENLRGAVEVPTDKFNPGRIVF